MPLETLTWDAASCYGDSWKGLVVPAAFAHPAKFARGLVRRIYQHALQQGWLAKGGTVLDCFGGVALGALDAQANGLHWLGVELEPRFVELGQQNLALWQRRFSTARGWGTARLVQGDSRNLAALVGGAEAVVSSPPYAESDQDYAAGWKRLGTENTGREASRMGKQLDASYGHTPGQLGALPPGDVDGVVSSPPYEAGISNHSAKSCVKTDQQRQEHNLGGGQLAHMGHYGTDPAQLGNTAGDTFWQAASQIVRQCHAVLKSGGVAIWVLKAFVRDGAIVDFPGQWQRLCEHAGFRTVQVIHASLIAETRHPSLFGGLEVKRVKRTSFFRRLHEKRRPDLAIDHEVVLVTRKD